MKVSLLSHGGGVHRPLQAPACRQPRSSPPYGADCASRPGHPVLLVTTPWNDIMTYVTYKKHITNIYGILAAPPCQAFSRARTVASTSRDLPNAMKIVDRVRHIIRDCQLHGGRVQFWALENPSTGLLKRFDGSPSFVFEPWQVGVVGRGWGMGTGASDW